MPAVYNPNTNTPAQTTMEFSLPDRGGSEPLPVTEQVKQRRVFGFDTETYYDKYNTVKKLGVDAYVNHSDFDCYLVSFFGIHGRYVGPPHDCPWDDFNNCTWVSHNARFDRAVFYKLKEQGKVPDHIHPKEWHDTASLSVYLQAPRSLWGASKALLDEEPDKSIRGSMKGIDWNTAKLLLQDNAIYDYALDDARLCHNLWIKYADKWPKHERELSNLTIAQGEKGIWVDNERLESNLITLGNECHAAGKNIPWYGYEPTTSLKMLKIECQKNGIPAPTSTAEDSEEFKEWFEEYESKIKWVKSIQRWRKANRMLKVLKTIKARTRPNGTLGFELKYFGANVTGRWSGTAGLNLQNFNREPLKGVDPRKVLHARPGHKFIIADLSQIEPRVLAWLSGDFELLERIRGGLPIYQAHAEASMGWTGGNLKKENPTKYLLAKCRVLGLGYGAGHWTFLNLAKGYGLKITPGEAHQTVKDFRAQNPKITKMWSNLEDLMRNCNEKTFFMKTPSGRFLRYFNVDTSGDEIRANTERGSKTRYKWYGGKLVENIVQATARDVFAEGMLRLHREGIPVLWSVHDEVITEVPEDSDITPDIVCALLAQTPSWMPGLPVEAEAVESQYYCK